MPVPELMTWIPAQRRWTKMYGGRRYYISARKLGCPETKEGSIHAANQWWRDKQAELDYAEKVRGAHGLRVPMPMEDLAAANMGVSADLFGNVRLLLEQALLAEEEQRKARKPAPPSDEKAEEDIPIPSLTPADTDPELIRRREVMALLEELLFGDTASLPPVVAEQLPPARVHQVESAAKAFRGEAVAEPDRTIKHLVEIWVQGQRTQAAIGNIVPRRYLKLRQHLAHFSAFLGEDNDVVVIDAERTEGFYNYCLARICDKRDGHEGGWSEEHAKNVFNTAVRFTRWLWERNLIELPKNLSGRNFRFLVRPKAVSTWTIEEIQEAVNASKAILKLSILLMLNTGMTQKDVSDLADSEVNWKAGTITRRRSKAKNYKDAPTVTYRLWPLTWQLLRQHRSGTERVLLTQTGRPLVRNDLVGEKVIRADIIETKYRKLKKRLTFDKPLKQLRKTGSTLLDKFDPSERISTMYLGHSPRSMKDRHYSRPDQERFDEAIAWLGQQFGFVE